MKRHKGVDALDSVRHIVLLELDPSVLNVKLDAVMQDTRSLNQLYDVNIKTVSDLAKLNRIVMPKITDRTINEVVALLKTIQNKDSALLKSENITIEQMISSLKDNQKRVLIENYGLLHEKYSLQDIGDDLGVTRERIRQIRNAGLSKIRKCFDPLLSEQIHILIKSARAMTCLNDIEDLTNVYKNQGLIELLIDAFPSLELEIHENKYLDSEVLMQKNKTKNFDKLINEVIDTLQYQTGFVPLNDVTENFGINKRILMRLKDSVVKDDHIALETNHNIFQRVFDVVVDTLRNEGKPMTTREIAKKSGLRWGQVRGVVMRKEKHIFANVGKSTYALTEWGYSELRTNELAYQYIKESGEPRLAKEVVKHVKLHKKIEDASILASISLDPRIVPIAPGLYSLKEWGDGNYYIHRAFEVKCADGILEVLRKTNTPLSINEILEIFKTKYGDSITDSYNTVSAQMKKLIEKNMVQKIGHSKRFVRYKLAQ